MDASMVDNDQQQQQQQLIQMSTLSVDELNKSVKSIANGTLHQTTSSEVKQQTIVLRLFSCSSCLFTSLHMPHFSDRSLRVTFLLFITLIGLTSFTNALIVGSSIVQFKQQCPLYASFAFETIHSVEHNRTIRINADSERFSSQSMCDFCTFYNVFAFIYCVMTGFFFVLFNGDHRIVTSNDRCLIIPWFPMSTFLGILGLVNASILTNGFLKFCSTMTSNGSPITSCAQINEVFFEKYPTVSFFFIYMLVAIIGSWFQLVFFIGVIAILTIRLGSSFDWSGGGDEKQTHTAMAPLEKIVNERKQTEESVCR